MVVIIALQIYRCTGTSEREIERLHESRRTLLQVAITALKISLGVSANHKVLFNYVFYFPMHHTWNGILLSAVSNFCCHFFYRRAFHPSKVSFQVHGLSLKSLNTLFQRLVILGLLCTILDN